jgi:peptidoglycan/xylan/chitin deacetylase (PgdA/CDA1 family)
MSFLRRHRLHILEAVVAIAVLVIFDFMVSNYTHNSHLRPQYLGATISRAYDNMMGFVKKNYLFGHCHEPEHKHLISGGFICRINQAASANLTIFDQYPRDDVKRYKLSQTPLDVHNADQIMQDKLLINGHIVPYAKDFDWTTDPYKADSWRNDFYSLNFLNNLANIAQSSHNLAYSRKLSAILTDYLNHGANKPTAQYSSNIVAMRTSNLISFWWQLRDQEVLSSQLSNSILNQVARDGFYLTDVNHYDTQSVHSLAESVALMEISVSFPTLPQAGAYRALGVSRLADGLGNSVDEQGAFFYYSPEQSLRVLASYGDVRQYMLKNNVSIEVSFDDTLKSATGYAANILTPNLHAPSIDNYYSGTFAYNKSLKKLAPLNPQFAYVLSGGKTGSKPAQTAVSYANVGQSILRSTWDLGASKDQQSQLILNSGSSYRKPIGRDTLGISLYGDDEPLIIDSSYYDIAPSPLTSYFSNAANHNTVTVDGKNQDSSFVPSGSTTGTGPGSTISGSGNTYKNISHQRSVSLINSSTYLLDDRLQAIDRSSHTYSAAFHILPGAVVRQHGNQIIVQSPTGRVMLRIIPVSTETAITTSLAVGKCTSALKQVEVCSTLTVGSTGTNSHTQLLFSVGPTDRIRSGTYDTHTGMTQLKLADNHILAIHLHTTAATTEKLMSKNTSRTASSRKLIAGGSASSWSATGPGSITDEMMTNVPAYEGIADTTSVSATVAGVSSSLIVSQAITADLSKSGVVFPFKVVNRNNMADINIVLTDKNGGTSKNDLKYAYPVQYEGQWVNISLGRSAERNVGGYWKTYSPNFDWHHVVNVSFEFKADSGQSGKISFGQVSTVPEPDQGSVVIIFDDGYQSILPTVPILKKYGYSANVGVIAKYASSPHKGYLDLQDLKSLQNKDGWNIVNHSYYHQAAVPYYSDTGNVSSYASDVSKGAGFLVDNGLDSAANWYVYPHGSTNEQIKNVVAQYYKYARSTINEPELFPWGDPLGVKTLSVSTPSAPDETTSTSTFPGFATTPSVVQKAVDDAKTYKTTLFLTFHRIKSTPSDKPGYDIKDFEKIISGIHASGIPVRTLSQLDASNGVAEQVQAFTPAKLACITTTVQSVK